MATPRRLTRIPLLAIGAVALVTLAACGNDDAADTTAPAATADPTTTVADTVAPTSPAPTSATTGTAAPSTTAPGLIVVTVGVDSSPDRIEPVALGTEVTLQVTNPDADDEFHLHGFDLGGGQVVPAGETATFAFVADRVGSFELESHLTGEVYLVLEVA